MADISHVREHLRSRSVARDLLRTAAITGVALAGAVVGIACFVLARAGGLRAYRYPGLSPDVSTAFALVGTAVGAVAWALVRRRAARPRAVLGRSVAVVVAVVLLADLVTAVRIGPLGGALLAVGHVVVIVMSVLVFRRVLPPPPDDPERGRRRGRLAEAGPGARWGLAVGLVAAAALWVLVNKPVEGPILLAVSSSHGLTAADLLSIAAGLAAVQLVRPRARPVRRARGG